MCINTQNVLFLFNLFYTASASDFFALLIAGSNGFVNYRHQADICNQYHLLTSVLAADPNQITVMMYDDAAWSDNNPLIGQLYNRPNGSNVYKNCEVDYRKRRVNSDTFLNILSQIGNSNSTVFLSFVDHGEPGYLLLPNGDQMHADTLIKGLDVIKANRTILYVEACHAGSLFDGKELPENTIVVTASNATESSWATYCPTPKNPFADAINGIHIGTCLADLFSASWVSDIERRVAGGGASPSTFKDHVSTVQEIVSPKSNVMIYGSVEILLEDLFDIFPARPASVFPSAAMSHPIISVSELLDSAQPVVDHYTFMTPEIDLTDLVM